ncbi:f-box protein skip23 [Fagus crenata]
MRSVTALPDFLRAGVFFQVAIFMAISLTRRYVISSSSIRVTLLMMLLISAFLSPVQAGDQDMSFIETTLRILTSLSAFLISESPSIVILILTDKSVISIIQPRIERVFLVHRSSSLVIGLDSNVNETQGTDHPSSLQLLPRQIIREIAQRITKSKDLKAFAGSCQECRSVCKEIASFQLPWLILSETPDTDIRHIFDLCDSNRYQLELSTVDGKRCWGSPHGWVVVLGPDYETHLEHLMTGVPIPLPPLDTIRREVAGREEWFRLVHKFILFKNVLDHDQLSFLVMAIFGPMNSLAFARVASDRGGAALNGRGQGDEWIIADNPNNWKFKDVARFRGQLYGFCDNGTLVRFELDPRLSAGVEFIASQPQDVGEPQKLYLVESLENLYGVFRYGYHVPSEKRHVTIYFLVYKFNFNASTWEEVTDLEDHAVFVGDGNSWCIPTSTINNKSNSIYFIDDNWEWQYGGHDVGVFDMARRVIQSLPFGEDNPCFHSRPNWITLSPIYT